jgi:hypothetical protein
MERFATVDRFFARCLSRLRSEVTGNTGLWVLHPSAARLHRISLRIGVSGLGNTSCLEEANVNKIRH